MRRVLLVLIALTGGLWAQAPQVFNGDPNGSCLGAALAYNGANGRNFNCVGGVWTQPPVSTVQTPLTTRGDVLTVNAAGALVRLALGAGNLYLKSNGLDLVYSTLPAAGTGSCTNQAVTALNADAAPGCSTLTSAFIDTSILSTTGAQSPTNKNLTAAGNGNTVTLLNQQFFAGALTGNGADQNLYSYALPANTLGAGKCLRITVAWLHASGTASTTYKLKFGATGIGSPASTGVDNGQREYAEYFVCNAAGVQNSQTAIAKLNLRTANVANVALNSMTFNRFADPAINFANAQTITFTFNVANTDTVSPEFWLVELIQ